MKPTLAIVGASTRSAAASAVRAGFQPITADLFADEDLRSIATTTRVSPYPEGMLDWLRALEPPAWMYTGALENHPALVDEMAWIAPLWGNPGDVLTRVRSPHELAAALQAANLLFPEIRHSPSGLPTDGSWLSKTYHGASGSGVRTWSGPNNRSAAAPTGEDHPPTSPLVYQERVGGTPCAAVFVAMEGKASLLGVTRQLVGEHWLGANEFQYCGSIGLCRFGSQSHHENVLQTIERIGDAIAAEFELAGLFGVDLVIDRTHVWTIEVNPRYTASVEIVERATGIAVLGLHAEACGSPPVQSIAVTPGHQLTHGKALLFAKRDVVISRDFADWSLEQASRKPWPRLADVSPAGTRVEARRPVLSVFAGGETAADVEQALRRRVAEIETRLYTHEATL